MARRARTAEDLPVPTGTSDEARRGLADFWFFATHYVGLELEEKPHRPVTDAIQAVGDGLAGNSLVVIPRGHYKTSIATAGLVWEQYRRVFLDGNFYYREMVGSATLGLGELILRRVTAILRGGGQNQRLHHDFPSLWRSRRWGQPGSAQPEGLFIAPRLDVGEDPKKIEPNFWVGSLRRISTGYHADGAYLDDLNNRDNVQTPFQRNKVQDYFDLVQPILVQNDEEGHSGRIVYTCTPWHDDDVRGRVQREEEKRRVENPEAPHEWEIVHFGCYDAVGEPMFPQKFPKETLEKLRRDLPASLFAANYLCDPLGDSAFVREDDIVFRDPASFPPLLYPRIAVDPNQHTEAKESGCWAAIIVAGFDRFGRYYILEADGSREWTSEAFLGRLFELREKYPDHKLLVEEPHMAHFEHAVKLEEARRSAVVGHPVRLRISWVPVSTSRSKYERFSGLEPRHRSRSVIYSDAIRREIKTELINELVRGPKARFQDFLDALAIGDTGFRLRLSGDGQPKEASIPKGEAPAPKTPTVADLYGGGLPYQ